MRLSIRDIQKMYAEGESLVMLTAYDMTSARLCDAAGVPLILVGDSLGMVIQGHDSPIPVRLEHIIYHSEIVVRNSQRAFVIGDMPFMSYNISPEQALANAARLMQEGGVDAVKLEGGLHMAQTIAQLTEAGIPVMAHIGLTPQSVRRLGGFRSQGRDVDSARRLLRDAQAVESAGAFAMVVEAVPTPLAQMITERVSIPTIGIGAGPHCDGQVQVFHDILGLFEDFLPRHAKHYATLGPAMREAIKQYIAEVQARTFPTDENSFSMTQEVLAALQADGADNGAGG